MHMNVELKNQPLDCLHRSWTWTRLTGH